MSRRVALALLAVALATLAVLPMVAGRSGGKLSPSVRDETGEGMAETVSVDFSYDENLWASGVWRADCSSSLTVEASFFNTSSGYATFGYSVSTSHTITDYIYGFSAQGSGSETLPANGSNFVSRIAWRVGKGNCAIAPPGCRSYWVSAQINGSAHIYVKYGEAWIFVFLASTVWGTPCEPRYTLTIRLYRATAAGVIIEPAEGVKVRIGDTDYIADSNGRVQVTLQQGSYSVEILDTFYGPTLSAGGVSTSWRRYRFWKWSDENTSNPR